MTGQPPKHCLWCPAGFLPNMTASLGSPIAIRELDEALADMAQVKALGSVLTNH